MPSTDNAASPLAGIRRLDLTRALAGTPLTNDLRTTTRCPYQGC